jgi:hypothetical protein
MFMRKSKKRSRLMADCALRHQTIVRAAASIPTGTPSAMIAVR